MIFFHSLKVGKLFLESNILIAPLAGYTNLPTRIMFRHHKRHLAYAEMVSAMGLKYNFKKSVDILKSEVGDEPLGIQLFGPNADSILNAFLKIKTEKFDLVDLNCGCSVKKVIGANAGAYLLRNPDEIYKTIYLLKQNTDKPVTLKIRSGWDSESINYSVVLDAAVKAGADLITFHPRTRAMLFKGKADWAMIRLMKEQSPIPVIGNGDIMTGADAVRMIKETGCDGIMLARGLIENPFLTDEVTAAFNGESYQAPTYKMRIDRMIKHFTLMMEYYQDKRGLNNFKKFIHGYLKGLPNAASARQALTQVKTLAEFTSISREYEAHLAQNHMDKYFNINGETDENCC